MGIYARLKERTPIVKEHRDDAFSSKHETNTSHLELRDQPNAATKDVIDAAAKKANDASRLYQQWDQWLYYHAWVDEQLRQLGEEVYSLYDDPLSSARTLPSPA